MKPKSTKSRIDSIIFKDMMYIKKEHTQMLGKFIIEQGYKIAKGKQQMTFQQTQELLDEIKKQVNKLQETYE